MLAEAGFGFGDVVEMTSYHLDPRAHFEVFCAVRDDVVRTPYPAWTAVEVAGLLRAGALAEIKAVAARP